MGVRSSTAQGATGCHHGHMSNEAPSPATDAEELLEFRCPRCEREVHEALYGPCGSCRTTLRALITAEAREVAAADYVPKMNVTPNAVASKE